MWPFKKHLINTVKEIKGGYQVISSVTVISEEDRHRTAFATESTDYRNTEEEAIELAQAKYKNGADVEIWKLINRYKH